MPLDSLVRPLCAVGLLIGASRLSTAGQVDDNPPISARRAIEMATAVKNRLVKDVGQWKWRYDRVHLEYRDIPSVGRRWYWRSNFEAWFAGMPPDVAPRVDVVVLMNGKTIEPVEAAKWKPVETK